MGDTSEMLRAAISANPYLLRETIDSDIELALFAVGPVCNTLVRRSRYMKVVCLNGYYDLATPFFGTEYTFAHLDLEPELRGNISMEYYGAGHMFYTDLTCLIKLAGGANLTFPSTFYMCSLAPGLCGFVIVVSMPSDAAKFYSTPLTDRPTSNVPARES